MLQQGLIISTFHGSYTVSKEHGRATAAGNHETSDEIVPATKTAPPVSGEAAVPVNNTCIARSNY